MKKTLLSAIGMLAAGSMMSQTFVDTTASNRNVVLEEFTGIHCTYCPDGHKRANELKANNPGRVVVSNIHAGGYATPSAGEPDFRTQWGEPIDDQSNLTGYPAGTVNREVFSSLAMNGGTAMSRANWVTAAASVMAEASPVNVAAQTTVDVNTRVMVVDVEVFYTDVTGLDTNMLNVALLQNNVKGPQTGASSFYPEMIDENGDYTHNHMLRHLLTGQWGEEIYPNTGNFFSKQYTYTLPADINGVDLQLGELEVIAFVAESNQYIYTGDYSSITYTGINSQYDVSIDNASLPVRSTCGSTAQGITFKLTNHGSEVVTSADIEITVNGTAVTTQSWSGSLNPLGNEIVTMDPVSLAGVDLAESYDIEMTLTNINGSNTDEDNTNNSDMVTIYRPTEGYATLTVTLTTDRYASEVGYSIKKGGTVILDVPTGSMSDLSSNTTATFTETIPYDGDGCFEVTITDSYGDGMSWTGGDGSGLVIVDAKGNTILDIPGDSYTEQAADNYFHAEYPAGTEEIVSAGLSLYPNPTNGVVTVKGLSGQASVRVFDLQGRMVVNNIISNNTLDVSGLTPGIYNVVVDNDGAVSTQRLSIIK